MTTTINNFIHHYFFISNDNTAYSIATDGYCDRSCGSLSVFIPHNNSIKIDASFANDISSCSKTCDLTLKYSSPVSIEGSIHWSGNNNLAIISSHNIIVSEGIVITNSGFGVIKLMSGIEGNDPHATIIFEDNARIRSTNGGLIKVYYNPVKGSAAHKYHNPVDYDLDFDSFDLVESYMLVNNVQDLQDISRFPSGNYALSRTIDAHNTSLSAIGSSYYPFSGNFDGNGYGIINLKLIGQEKVGLFGAIAGSETQKNIICDLWISNAKVEGSYYVGILAGYAEYTIFSNITLKNSNQCRAEAIVGGLVGSGVALEMKNIIIASEPNIIGSNHKGILCGALKDSVIKSNECYERDVHSSLGDIGCVGLSVESIIELENQ